MKMKVKYLQKLSVKEGKEKMIKKEISQQRKLRKLQMIKLLKIVQMSLKENR